MLEIPIYQNVSADFQQTITLENKRITIRLTWNIRSQKWNMRISSEGYELTTVALVENYLLLFRNKALFPVLSGDLIVLYKTQIQETLNYDNLGNSLGLYYLNPDEVETWRVENGLE